jgi:hypothetical protein
MSHFQSRWLAPILVLIGLSSNMYAVDGVVLIDQNHALAGNVTPGDAPGFPVTISVPGSYRLAGNLTVPAGMDGIQISANNVTVDLNGFQITGPGSGIGVNATNQVSVAVLNGAVFQMGGSGIVAGPFARIEKVQANNNNAHGIDVGTDSSVSDCVAHNNNFNGINAADRSSIQNNTASFNGRNGISSSTITTGPTNGFTSIVRGNTANRNIFDGITANEALVSGNTANENAVGFFITGGVVAGNLAVRNTVDGFSITSALITGNTARANGGAGLRVDSFFNDAAAYKGNILARNSGGNVIGAAINLGDNVCDLTLCP